MLLTMYSPQLEMQVPEAAVGSGLILNGLGLLCAVGVGQLLAQRGRLGGRGRRVRARAS